MWSLWGCVCAWGRCMSVCANAAMPLQRIAPGWRVIEEMVRSCTVVDGPGPNHVLLYRGLR